MFYRINSFSVLYLPFILLAHPSLAIFSPVPHPHTFKDGKQILHENTTSARIRIATFHLKRFMLY